MDIQNASIQTRTDDKKYMATIKIRGFLVDILIEISPDVYVPCVITDRKVVKQLIFQCKKAIFDTMLASLLYYKKFRRSLKDEGYEFNIYDPSAAKKIIKGIQMTAYFHVDNCNLSNKILKAVGKTIPYLN